MALPSCVTVPSGARVSRSYGRLRSWLRRCLWVSQGASRPPLYLAQLDLTVGRGAELGETSWENLAAASGQKAGDE